MKQAEDNYKPVRTGNVLSSNYVEYKSNGNKDKAILIEDYLGKFESYLKYLIDNHKTQREWKIQLGMTINFSCSKDSNETRIMHTKSNNISYHR